MQTPNFIRSRWLGFVLGRLAIAVMVAALLSLSLPPVEAAQVVTTPTKPVTVEIGQGAVVRLTKPATTVFVADPEICDIQMKSPRLIYLIGKKPGKTTLIGVDAGENIIANIDITISHGLSRLQSAVRSIQPDVSVRSSSVDGAILLEGNVNNASAIENVRDVASQLVGKDGRVINRVGVTSSNQVNLRVRIAEISRDIEKQLGFNWQYIGEMFGINTAFSFVNPFVGIGAVADAIGISHKNHGQDVNTVISALEEEGLINILAEPNLTALSGETASFLAGGEFPILVPDEDRIVVEFKKFGVSLAFTPTVLADGQINLHVRPEVSRLTSEGAVNLPLNSDTVITVPALSVRRAETTVELGSGQSFAIGGLLNNDVAHDIHKVPGLGDVPIIGRLFTSDRFRRNESELVIIVTPYLVRPSPQRLALPNDGFQPPNDLERLFPGGTWKRNPVPAPKSTVRSDGSRLVGPVGFALE